MSDLLYIQDALNNEFPIAKLKETLGMPYLEKGLHTSFTNTQNGTHLQFHGWEIVLCKDGHYYINDTSGG